MESQLLEIREQQKASWNKSSPGWKKWDDLTMDFLKPFGDEIVRQLELEDSDLVLDVAAGTGEPGLTIARKVKSGKVIITDLADDMLVIAHENAERAGIKNVEFSVCDVCELPFEDNTFDAISCRMGFMFFPDMLMAAKEMVRVLKPGGRVSASVWCVPDKNFWVAGALGVVRKHVELPTPPPGAPGMFRCAKEGMIADLFAQAGLKNVSQKEVDGILKCGTTDVYWSFVSEVVGPVVSALGLASDETRANIKSDLYEAVRQKYPDGKVMIDATALIISGEK